MSLFDVRRAVKACALGATALALAAPLQAAELPLGIVSATAAPGVILQGNSTDLRVVLTPPPTFRADFLPGGELSRRGAVELDFLLDRPECFDLSNTQEFPDSPRYSNPNVRTMTVPSGQSEKTVTLRSMNGCAVPNGAARKVIIKVWIAGTTSNPNQCQPTSCRQASVRVYLAG